MDKDTLLIAGLLSLERIFYAIVCHAPKQITRIAPGEPGCEPEFIFRAVHVFKLVQAVAFGLWYVPRFGLELPPVLPSSEVMGAALALLACGQTLNALVWQRIGIEGVCYGVKFGRQVPWCTRFPFNAMNDPQYFGAIFTVWALFLLTSAAAPRDWYTIPMIETMLYMISMKVEY